MRLNMGFEILELDDECVAVPIGDGYEAFHGVLKVNNEGAEILKLLKQETSVEGIADELLKEYSITRVQLVEYISNFVEQLRKNGLLTE